MIVVLETDGIVEGRSNEERGMYTLAAHLGMGWGGPWHRSLWKGVEARP